MVVELEVVAEHGQKVLFEAHHQRVDPGVEQNIGALHPHLRGVAGGEILHMGGRRDHCAGDAQALGDVALHLRAEDEFRLKLGDRLLDLEIVVGDEGGAVVQRRRGPDLPRKFAVVGAEAHDLEAHLLRRYASRGDGVGRVAEDEDALAGQVVAVDGPRPPGHPSARHLKGFRGVETRDPCDLIDEVERRADADRRGSDRLLAELTLQPRCGDGGDLGIEHDVEVGVAQAGQVGGARAQRRCDIDLDADQLEQPGDFDHIIAVAKAERGGAKDVAARLSGGAVMRL